MEFTTKETHVTAQKYTPFTPTVAQQYFDIRLLEDGYYHLFDFGKSKRAQTFGAPQYLPGRYATLAAADAGVREYANDRGDL